MPRKNKQAPYKRGVFVASNCKSKKAYRSEHEAQNAAEMQMLINQQLEIAMYKCDSCKKWHLTRKT